MTIAFLALILILIVVFFVIWGNGFGQRQSVIPEEKAVAIMDKLYEDIRVSDLPPIMENVDLESQDLADILPDISRYPAQVRPLQGTEWIEILSSTEKASVSLNGPDYNRWLVDMAVAFNSKRIVIDGVQVSVSVRGMASGVAMDYISSGKHIPDAFTPSNTLWGDALKSYGMNIELVTPRLTGNVAGIVIQKPKYDAFIAKYGAVSVETILKAVSEGEFTMGYTNPFASSTGANFLISLLNAINPEDPLGEDAVAAFERFQTNVPFVAYTTLQMTDSAKSGILDGFVFEYQQFVNSPDISQSYVFTPFGVRHDSPVYILDDISPARRAILHSFVEFCQSPESQDAARALGFNGHADYQPTPVDGSELPNAQKLFKEKKSGNRNIVAVFVADNSGSMSGKPIRLLRESLANGAKFIGPNNYVGLVQFANNVQIAVPIDKFDLNQRSLFTGAAKNMTDGGGTAMFDAIVVAEKMIHDVKPSHPNSKFMIFVLTDGETTEGARFKDVRDMIAGLQVPIHTIGYNANLEALREVSRINEAASIIADTDDVVYQIQSFFNAEM
ncbi:MAG: VWA domain-containing protein [Deltaproteobacteria bacterium]|nr:VWA domain-containing protein [Deltaproteobacteria bacterium]